MTDLLTRAMPSRAGGPGSAAPVARPLTVSAAISGAGAALATLVICMALALTGWFLADAGAHGQTTDALRVGADAWLLGLGSRLTVAGLPVGITPLGLTLVLAWVSYRCGRWAGSTSQPIEEDRSFAIGATIHTGLYLVVTVLTTVLATTTGATPGVGRAILGALVVGGVAGSLGMAVGSGRAMAAVERIPWVVRDTARGAVTLALALLGVSAVLVLGSLVHHLDQAANVMSALHLSPGSGVMYVLVCVVAVPNAVLLGSAYLLGPGFAVGTATVVSPTVVSLGPVPAFPLLAALPGDGPTPGWLAGLVAVPLLVGVVTTVLVQRARPTRAWDVGAIRGLGSGVGAAVILVVLVSLAGGPMGTGRMAHIGAPAGEVLLTALGSLGIGGLLGGLGMTWWQRRTLVDEVDPAEEDTIVLPLLGDPFHNAD